MLNDHRRALWYALALLASLGFVLVAVGRHPASLAPQTTFPFVGRFDQQMYDAVDHIRVTPLTWLFRFLNVVGGGVVTIPLRAIASLYLLARRWWRRAAAFILTWAASELMLTFLKAWFHRGRPPAEPRGDHRLLVPLRSRDRGRRDRRRAGAGTPRGRARSGGSGSGSPSRSRS